jgi:hypothetical protein
LQVSHSIQFTDPVRHRGPYLFGSGLQAGPATPDGHLERLPDQHINHGPKPPP